MSTTQRPALAELANPAILPDPYPVLAGLREASPFAEFDGAFVVAGRHADIAAVLRDPNASSERNLSRLPGAAPRRRTTGPRFCPWTRPTTPGCAAWSPKRSPRAGSPCWSPASGKSPESCWPPRRPPGSWKS